MFKKQLNWIFVFVLFFSYASFVSATPVCDCEHDSECAYMGGFCWTNSLEGCQSPPNSGICMTCEEIREGAGGGCNDDSDCGVEAGCGLACTGFQCGYPAEFSSYGWMFVVVGMLAVSFFLIKKRLK